MLLKGSDYISRFLEEKGVKTVFELSGGMITHMLDSISRRGKIRIMSVHHEQAAAFAADAVGRLTGIPGVAMATSGPGATNLLTGIGSCYFDSSPSVFITGQVNRHEQKGDRAIRQLGFQETDIVAMAHPITKAAWLVQEPEDLPKLLQKAFDVAMSGRPGPVLVDIPMDIQRIETDFQISPESTVAGSAEPMVNPADCAVLLNALLNAIRAASRPLILAGGGVRLNRDLLRRFAQIVQVPVVKSLLGVDSLAYDDPMNVGMIGSYGNRWANIALGQSDLLLVLGSRLDIRQTGSQTEAFREERTIFHVDCDAGEMNNRIAGCITLESDLRPFLEAAITRASGFGAWEPKQEWIAQIHSLREQWPDTSELEGTPGINPNEFMHLLSRALPEAGAYVVDVGQHQMWAAQSIEVGADQRFLTSGGMGSMGFALPAALGAAVSDPTRPVVVIAGDGAFQCNLQELQTVVRNKLPLKIVVMDNGCHGMVRQFQESYFDGHYQSTLLGYSAPDFARVAAAYGLESCAVADPACVGKAIEWLRSTGMRPALLHVKIDTYSNAYPKMAFGRPITEMEPFAKPLEQEGT